MPVRATIPCWTALLAAGCLLAGCSKPSRWDRVALQGNVTATDISNPDDVNGTLTIVPAAGNKGPAAVTSIKAGKYQFTSTNGPIAGECEVTVTLFDPEQSKLAAHSSTAPARSKPMPGNPGDKFRSMNLPDRKKSIQVPNEKSAQLDLDL